MKTFVQKIKCSFMILIAVSAMYAGIAVGEETNLLSLEQLLPILMENNPDIQAAESRHQAALARPSQARTLPNPTVSFVTGNGSGNPIPFTKLGEEMGSSVGVMWEQEFPYPGKLGLAGEMASKEAEAAGSDVDAEKWMAQSDLKQAFYEYFQTDRSIDILRESLGLLRHFEEIARKRYEVGEGIQQDVLRAQLEISILEQRLTSLEQERASAAAEINRLLNRPVDTPLAKPSEVTATSGLLSLEALHSEYSVQAPQIRSAEFMVSREQSGLDLAKKEYRPDFMTKVEYANSPNFPDMWEIEFGLRIPLFYKSKQRFGVVEALRNLTRAQKELRSIQQEIAFNIKDEYLKIQASDRLLKLYSQAILPQSNLALESSLTSYQVGKSDFLTTITNFMTLLEYRMNYYEELARHESAIARLERAVGRPVTSGAGNGGGNNHE